MRLVTYNLELSKTDRTPVLVKEKVQNYPYAEEFLNPSVVVHTMNEVFHASSLAEEHVWLLALNTKANPIGIFEISHGGSNYALMGKRENIIRLLLAGAVGAIAIHCHPSGNPSPSEEDNRSTEELKQACNFVGINLLDHIIIGEDTYYSYKEHGFID